MWLKQDDLYYIAGKKLKNLTDQQAELMEKFRQPRAEYARMPVHLSDRSSPKNYPKKMRLAHEGRPTEEGCWEKVGMNCLRIFVCIFDWSEQSEGEEEDDDEEEEDEDEQDDDEDGGDGFGVGGNGNGNGGGRNLHRDDGGWEDDPT